MRTLLAGGYRNRVWRVRTPAGDLVEKVYALDDDGPNPVYLNLPDHEAAVLAALGPTGLVPSFVSFRARDGRRPAVLTYRFVPGRPWRRGVGEVAVLLRRVHDGEVPRGMRPLLTSGAAAADAAHAMLDDVPAAMARRLRPHVPDSRSLSSSGPSRLALVHTDCGPGNVLRTAAGLVLIDWQCPGRGDPVEDIACFLSPAIQSLYGRPPLGERARRTFLDAYGDTATAERYHEHATGWHARLAAYCVWRAHRLRRSDPDVAARYRAALDAELTHGPLARPGRRS